MLYRVTTYGGMDGLDFPDLLIRYSTGYLLPLKVKEGEYIPLEILDPLDVKKSLLAGSLGRYIAAGYVSIVNDPIIVQPTINKKQPLPAEISPTQSFVSSTETLSETSPQPVLVQQKVEEQLTNLSQVKVVDDFFKLGYFLKLRFIKECTNKALLQEIFTKTDSNQLRNNIQLKLSQI